MDPKTNKDSPTTTTTTSAGNNTADANAILQQRQEGSLAASPLILYRKDIWISNILPFLGPGNYIFVASVCKDLKEIYQEYYDSIDEDDLPCVSWNPKRGCELKDTFYRAAFASLSRAKFWDDNTQQERASRLQDNKICKKIAKYGNVETLEWAHKQRGFPWDTSSCFEAAGGGNMRSRSVDM